MSVEWINEDVVFTDDDVTWEPKAYYPLGGLIEGQSGVTGTIQSVETLAGTIAAQSALTAGILEISKLAGSLGATSSVVASLTDVRSLAGSIVAVSSAEASLNEISSLAGSVAGQSTVSGNLSLFQVFLLAGSIAAQSDLTAKLQELSSLSGSIAAQSTTSGRIISTEKLSGIIAAQSSVVGVIQSGYAVMPPEMHEALIDPYSGGAWLWLVEIKLPGYGLLRYARDRVNIIYAGQTYTKNNFDPGLAALTGDGSLSRTALKVAQDANYTLEDKINATQGGSGGWVKIIRAHEDFLDKFIDELEQITDILTAESDTIHVKFTLGIQDPLRRKVPLYIYSSKHCPYMKPGLFKGPECQYAGADPTCTGKYEDCFTKGNQIHYGADLGLDPNTVQA